MKNTDQLIHTHKHEKNVRVEYMVKNIQTNVSRE